MENLKFHLKFTKQIIFFKLQWTLAHQTGFPPSKFLVVLPHMLLCDHLQQQHLGALRNLAEVLQIL